MNKLSLVECFKNAMTKTKFRTGISRMYYYGTKDEAIAFTKKLMKLARKEKSND